MLPRAVYAVIAVSLLCLAACAPPARSERMVPPPTTATDFPANSGLRDSIALKDVGGGEESSTHSNVGDKELREALLSALRQQGLLQTDDARARFRLNVFLVELSHPSAGFSFTVYSLVRYTLSRADTGAVLFDDVVNASYTATVGEEFIGIVRLRAANEGSIRANIAAFLERLKALPIPTALEEGVRITTAVAGGS
jgi:hypothetical protein